MSVPMRGVTVNAFFSKFLESGLIAAVVMGVAYVLTFFNIAGALDAFYLPHELITIGIPQIIETIFKVVVNIWAILPLIIIVVFVTRPLHNHELLRCIYSTAFLIGIIMFTFLVLDYFLAIDWILIAIVVYIWVKHLARPLLVQRKTEGYINKWNAHYGGEKEDEKSVAKNVAARIAIVCLVICGLYYTSQTMYEYGKKEAGNATWHYIAHDYNDKVIVFQSDWYYVLMARDGDTLIKSYQVVRFDELGVLSYENTGVLHVEQAVLATSDR
jgi:hypothetical protein